MNTTDLLKKVRKIEIKSKKLSTNIFAGEYHSRFKGKGMSFAEVRLYQYGDDIRHIDWNVTARYNQPYVKVFEEERELTVILLIDMSASGLFGSYETKRNYLTEIAALLAFSAISNNDKIGVVFFTDKVEKFIPPKKGRKHILRIIREMLTFKSSSSQTDIAKALEFLVNTFKRRVTVFILSDFLSKDFSKALKIAAYKHDVSALFIYDRLEAELPDIGIINALDAETGNTRWIDTSSAEVEHYRKFWQTHIAETKKLFDKTKVDNLFLTTDIDYIKPLINFFKKRAK